MPESNDAQRTPRDQPRKLHSMYGISGATWPEFWCFVGFIVAWAIFCIALIAGAWS